MFEHEAKWQFPKLAGVALVALAIISPLAYCTYQEGANRNLVKIACIEAKGTWSWGECAFPEEAK